jgi:hypothetical protein
LLTRIHGLCEDLCRCCGCDALRSAYFVLLVRHFPIVHFITRYERIACSPLDARTLLLVRCFDALVYFKPYYCKVRISGSLLRGYDGYGGFDAARQNNLRACRWTKPMRRSAEAPSARVNRQACVLLGSKPGSIKLWLWRRLASDDRAGWRR